LKLEKRRCAFTDIHHLSEQHPREQGLKQRHQASAVETRRNLSEQHPREQGLKHVWWICNNGVYRVLSEQHPREQGLKPVPTPDGLVEVSPFQSNIQENKD